MKTKSLLLILAITIATSPLRAEIISGTCGAEGEGSNLTWELNTEDSVLTISGSGEMANWEKGSEIPWYNHHDEIKTIILSDSITNIGKNAFLLCRNLISIEFPTSILTIGDEAFQNCRSLETIEIPENVQSVNYCAFRYCTNLKTVILHEGLQTLGMHAFMRCDSLRNISLPKSLTDIGVQAFYDCNNLPITGKLQYADWYLVKALEDDTTYNIRSNTKWISGDAFTNHRKLKSLVIPEGVEVLEGAFEACMELTQIKLPSTLRRLGGAAFYGCISLSSINIPLSLDSIESDTFWGCGSLKSLSLPENILSIGSNAFESSGLQSIILPANLTSIGSEAFYYSDSLRSIEIPANVKFIGSGAFMDCKSLSSFSVNWEDPLPIDTTMFLRVDIANDTLLVPGGTSNKYKSADVWKDFGYIIEKDCLIASGYCGAEGDSTNLRWELSCDSVLTISGSGEMADWGYTSSPGKIRVPWYNYRADIKTIILSDSITSIGCYAFNNFSSLVSVTIPESVVTIGYGAFYQCNSLPVFDNIRYADTYCVGAVDKNATQYVIKEGTKWIGSQAFSSCYKATSVIIPEGVISIGGYAFQGSHNITSIALPTSLLHIEIAAFYQVQKLDSIIIPKAVISIGNMAFDDTNIASFYLPSNVQHVGTEVLGDCHNLTRIEVDAENPYYDSRNDCNAIIETATNKLVSGCKTTIIPSDIEIIEEEAFWGSLIASVTIPASVSRIEGWAFQLCDSLRRVDFLSSTPPSIDNAEGGCFLDAPCEFYVPCGSKQLYVDSLNVLWNYYDTIVAPARIHELVRQTYSIYSSNDEWGSVSITQEPTCEDTLTIQATSTEGYQFKQWSDGNTDNPRTIELTQDTTLIAEFELAKCLIASGYCGAEGDSTNLRWELSCDSVLTISGSGAMENLNQAADYPWYEYQKFIAVVIIEDSVKNIGNKAFDGFHILKNVTIGNNVTTIGKNAFADCFNLKSIFIPQSVTSIGTWVFNACSGLTTITVDSMNTIYDSRENCNALIETATNTLIAGCKNTIIPNSITSIGAMAFRHCHDLRDIEIPNSVTNIGTWAFAYCTGLTDITIPNSVISMGESAFENCSGLTHPVYNAHMFVYLPVSYSGVYMLPDGIKTIAGGAFMDCANLTSINISDSVTVIGRHAFYNCANLISFTCEAMTPPICGAYAFDKINKSIPLYVPCTSVALYKATEQWQEFTNILPYDTISFTTRLYANDSIMGKVIITEQQYITCGTSLLTIQAVANDGYHFVQWLDGNTDNPRTIELMQDTTLIAEFAINPPIYTLTLEMNNNLMGVVDGDGQYEEQTTACIYAHPYETYQFIGWYAGDTLLSTYDSMCFNIKQDTTLTAMFEPIPMSAELAMIYINDTPVENFSPETFNYTFHYPAGTQESDLPTQNDITWLQADEYQNVTISQTDNTVVLNVISGRGLTKAYVLTFIIEVPNMYMVTALSNDTQWGTVTGGGLYADGSEVQLTATPKEGYQFYNWNNDITDNPHSFTIMQDTSFVAMFLPDKEEEVISAIGSNSMQFEWEHQPFAWGYWLYVYLDYRHEVWLCRIQFIPVFGILPVPLLHTFEWGPGFGPNYQAQAHPQREPMRILRRIKATETDNIISYTLDGLAPETMHYFTIEAFDEQEKVVEAQAGSCATTKEVPTNVEEVNSKDDTIRKFIIGEQIFIQRNGKIYTITGQNIK